MGNVLERFAQQLVFGVAKHHAQCMITQEKRAIWVDQRHPDRRVLKCRAKAHLAGSQGLLRRLSLGDVQVHALPGDELSCFIMHSDALRRSTSITRARSSGWTKSSQGWRRACSSATSGDTPVRVSNCEPKYEVV